MVKPKPELKPNFSPSHTTCNAYDARKEMYADFFGMRAKSGLEKDASKYE